MIPYSQNQAIVLGGALGPVVKTVKCDARPSVCRLISIPPKTASDPKIPSLLIADYDTNISLLVNKNVKLPQVTCAPNWSAGGFLASVADLISRQWGRNK